MLKSKAFVKINRGGYQKVIKEHYLRDDIPCGLKSCGVCQNPTDTVLLEPESKDNPQLLLPDTNIILHHLNVLEDAHFTDVIILQTVLDEVRSRNGAIYSKMRTLIQHPLKRFFVFSNEHHKETYVEREGGETDNDRNDRAIRRAALWYSGHTAVQTVLLTNDKENERRAVEVDKLAHVHSLLAYLRGISGRDHLVDLVESAMASIDADADEEERYEAHLPLQVLKDGVLVGKFVEGILRTSPYNTFSGTVAIETPGAPYTSVVIQGRMLMNRAINGDRVAVQVLPRHEWGSAGDRVSSEALHDDDDTVIVEGEAKPGVVSSADARASGRIVGILTRKTKALCGSIDRKTIRESSSGLQGVLFVPMDRHYPRIRFQTRQAEQLRNQRIIVVIDTWAEGSRYPSGHYLRTLGEAGDRLTETEAILLEHDVSHEAFTPQVIACLPAADWDICEADLAERRDFRDLCVCSVDPPGCTDIDDALHARSLPNGNVEVGVHIADVTHFVSAGTAVDREAAARATTVYLVDRRIDMLPGLLGTNLCSLRSKVNRLAFSCVWEIDPKTAAVVATSFCKSVIRSRASLTYDQAQERLDSAGDGDEITRGLKLLNGLAKLLKARRIEAGSLTLASPEFRFSLDTETQNPVDVEMKEMRDANSMVEEFMLLANCSVAKRVQEAYPDSAILRRHPAPPPENFEALNGALKPYGFQLDPSTSKALAKTLDQAVLPHDPYFNRLVRIMTTRCMLQAVYFAAGSVIEEQFWHYGLATPIYTHFTSPIRRYADVVVHRQLAACIGAVTTHFRDRQDPGVAAESMEIIRNKQRVEDLAHNINYRHRMAQYAQRSSVELYTHLYFRGKDITETAYVIKVMQNGFVALIPKYGIEGLIHVSEGDPIHYDAIVNAFIDRQDNGVVAIKLFQRIEVHIKVQELEASQRQKLMVTLLDPPVLLQSLKKARMQ